MKRTLCILLLVSFSACEKEFDIFDVPGKEFKIAIQSFNQVGQPWYIQTAVSKSTAPLGTLDELEDAIVKIYEDGNFVEQLTFSGFAGDFVHPAIYRSVTNSPKVGHEYRITVEAPGYPMASATYKQPDPVPAEMTFQFRSKQTMSSTLIADGVTSEIQFTRLFYDVTYTFTDPPGDNFYDFRLETAATEDDFRKGTYAIAQLYPEADLYVTDMLSSMTDDSMFAGKRVTIKFVYYINEENAKSAWPWLRMSLRTMTAEQYQYTQKLVKGLYASYDPYAQPVTTFTNVENGLGSFSAYTPYSKIINYSFEE